MATSDTPPESQRRRPQPGPDTIAVLHVYADYADTTLRDRFSDRLDGVAQGSVGLLYARLRESVAAHLGPDFTVSEMSIQPGSLELLVLIGLIGGAVQTYGAVRQGLDYIRQDARRIVEEFLDVNVPPGYGLNVAAYYDLGPAVEKFPVTQANGTRTGLARVVSSPEYPVLLVSVVILFLLCTLLAIALIKVL
jgi:hypothetical protein